MQKAIKRTINRLSGPDPFLFLVSVLFTLLLYFLLPVNHDKHILESTRGRHSNELNGVFRADFDNDQNTERVGFREAYGKASLLFWSESNQVIGQVNFDGEWVILSDKDRSDLDQDGYLEILAFVWFRDSIRLVVEEYMQGGEGMHIVLPVCKALKNNESQDWKISLSPLVDLNDDGKAEFFFSVFSGFTKSPRKLFYADPFNQIIREQETEFANNINEPVLTDLDGNGIPEITGISGAPHNFGETSLPYHDSSSWLMVYNEKLALLSEPVEYPGSPSNVQVLPFSHPDRDYLLVACYDRSVKDLKSLLSAYCMEEGELKLERSFEYKDSRFLSFIGQDNHNPEIFYLMEGDKVVEMNLEFQGKVRPGFDDLPPCRTWYRQDLNGDGIPEYTGIYNTNELVVICSEMKHYNRIGIEGGISYPFTIDNYAKASEFYVSDQSGQLPFKYYPNPLFRYRFLFLFLMLVLSYLLFFVLFRFYRLRLETRQKERNRLLRYQLANVQQQLDPHFLFNVLNHIVHYYQEGKKEDAFNYVSRISSLVVSSMENAEKLTIKLSEELNFVRNYLYIEKIRQSDSFDFEIQIDDDLAKTLEVPKMMLQNFVENSVKHGIRHLESRKGMIRLYSYRENGKFMVIIEDNGIGRKKAAAKTSFGKGKGIEILRRSLSIYEKLYTRRIEFEIEDLSDSKEESAGTRVKITITL